MPETGECFHLRDRILHRDFHQSLHDVVAVDFRFQQPCGSQPAVLHLEVERPGDAVGDRSVILEHVRRRIISVGFPEDPPDSGDPRGMFPPFETGQAEEEVFFRVVERFECQFSGRSVHQSRIIPEIPALHHA